MGGEIDGQKDALEPEPEDRASALENEPENVPQEGHFKIYGHLHADIRLQRHFMNTMLPLDYEIPVELFLPLLEKFAAAERGREQDTERSKEAGGDKNGEVEGDSEEDEVPYDEKRISSSMWEELQTKFMLELPESQIENELFDTAVGYIFEPRKIDELRGKLLSLEHRRRHLGAQQAKENNARVRKTGEGELQEENLFEKQAGFVGSSDVCEALLQCGVPMLEIMNVCRVHKDHDALIGHAAFVTRLRDRHGVRLPGSAPPVLTQPKLKSKERLELETVKGDNRRKDEEIQTLSKKLSATKKELKELKKKVDHQFFNELFSMVNNTKKTDEEVENKFKEIEEEDEGSGQAEGGRREREAAELEVEAETPRASQRLLSEMTENEFAEPGMMVMDGTFVGKIITSSEDAEPDAQGERKGLQLNIMLPLDGQLPIALGRAFFQALAQSAMKFREVYRHKGAAGSRIKQVWEDIDSRLETLYPNAGEWQVNGSKPPLGSDEQDEFWKSEYEDVKRLLAQKQQELLQSLTKFKETQRLGDMSADRSADRVADQSWSGVTSSRPAVSSFKAAPTFAPAPTFASAPARTTACTYAAAPTFATAPAPAPRRTPGMQALLSQSPRTPREEPSLRSPSTSANRLSPSTVPKPQAWLTSSRSAEAPGASLRSMSASRTGATTRAPITASASAAAVAPERPPRTPREEPSLRSPSASASRLSPSTAPMPEASLTNSRTAEAPGASLRLSARQTGTAAPAPTPTGASAAAPRPGPHHAASNLAGSFAVDLASLREIARENPHLKRFFENPWFPEGGSAGFAAVEGIASVSRWKGLTVEDGRIVGLQMQVVSLPNEVGRLTALTSLDLNQSSALHTLPDTIGNLAQLTTLKLGACRKLAYLPDSVAQLSSLSRLDLWHCTSIDALPPVLPKSLKNFTIKGCPGITRLPPRLAECTSIQTLDLNGCSGMTSLPAFLGNLPMLASSRGSLDVRNLGGATGSAVVERLIAQGCRVTAHTPASSTPRTGS